MQKKAFIKSILIPIAADKLYAINMFFLVWICTAYIRWKVYLFTAKYQEISWLANVFNSEYF
ncbi:hypothetical protein NEHOM01_0177 [Nematocida homosporus]|uniref:uncharacterized protein n=1 Tax=Nematocida homosporus TaxID=1912981 RepID=UPI00221FEA15|nr:uncharacterized protein NEHOM01_0177 [Nematocida homosporus]KAI5184502.1 hypothetical protein NEHOM01_0177 [Nematocida homosporus]